MHLEELIQTYMISLQIPPVDTYFHVDNSWSLQIESRKRTIVPFVEEQAFNNVGITQFGFYTSGLLNYY